MLVPTMKRIPTLFLSTTGPSTTQKSPPCPPAVSTDFESNVFAASVKNSLGMGVLLHCYRKCSYNACGSNSGLTLQGRAPSLFEDLSMVSISTWYCSYSAHALMVWDLSAKVFQLLKAKYALEKEHSSLQQLLEIMSWIHRAPSLLKWPYT